MIYLVCEGKSDLLDRKVLELIIVNHCHKNVKFESVGGDSSLKSVARWLEATSENIHRAYVIEDRNFRPLSVAEQTWNDPNRKNFIWRRHEIENYLLDPRIIAAAFQALKASGVRGSDALPMTDQTVLGLLKTLARPMLEYHAGKLTFEEVQDKHRQMRVSLCGPDEGDLLSQSASGISYPDRTGWLTYFETECTRLKQACQNLIADVQCDISVVEKLYDNNLSRLNTPLFFDQQLFLCEMGGHELMSQLLRYLNNELRLGISRPVLTKGLLEALDRLYQPGFFVPDDFQELAAKLS